jgi:hypothetical protein
VSKPAKELEREITAKVRSRKYRARGVWWTVRMLIESNEGKHPGDLRTPDGAAITAENLADDGYASAGTVLSCLQQLEAVGLLKKLESGVWHSGYLARLYEVRDSVRDRVRRHRVLRNTQEGVTSPSCNANVTPRPPPPSLSPPYTPSIPSPTPEYPNAAHSAGDVGSDAGENGKPSRKKAKEPKFPPGVWERAVEGWGKAFHHVHRSEFHWNPRQTKGLSEVLQALKGDLGRFEQVAKAWLREPEHGLTKGHPLWQLAVDLNYVESKIAQGTVGLPPSGANGAHATPAERKRTAVEQALERRIAQ